MTLRLQRVLSSILVFHFVQLRDALLLQNSKHKIQFSTTGHLS